MELPPDASLGESMTQLSVAPPDSRHAPASAEARLEGDQPGHMHPAQGGNLMTQLTVVSPDSWQRHPPASAEDRLEGDQPKLAQPAQGGNATESLRSAREDAREAGEAGEAGETRQGSTHEGIAHGGTPEEAGGPGEAGEAGEAAPEEGTPVSASAQGGPKWDCYVIVHSVSKKHNIGMLLRSATAFGVRQMVVVGRRDISTFGNHGTAEYVDLKHFYHMKDARTYLKWSSVKLSRFPRNHGTADYVDLKHFYHMKDARTYLKDKGCTICGVEIVEGAQAIQSHPFTGHTAFLLGNEGSGLSQQELDFCDCFVYIPQYGAGTASLNVVVAASIILHHFGVWAKYAERDSAGGKFVVGERPQQRRSRNACPEDAEEVLERRRERDRAAARDEWVEHADGSLFSEESEP